MQLAILNGVHFTKCILYFFIGSFKIILGLYLWLGMRSMSEWSINGTPCSKYLQMFFQTDAALCSQRKCQNPTSKLSDSSRLWRKMRLHLSVQGSDCDIALLGGTRWTLLSVFFFAFFLRWRILDTGLTAGLLVVQHDFSAVCFYLNVAVPVVKRWTHTLMSRHVEWGRSTKWNERVESFTQFNSVLFSTAGKLIQPGLHASGNMTFQ